MFNWFLETKGYITAKNQVEVNSGLVDTVALRLHRRIKLASKKIFPTKLLFPALPW